MTDDFDKWVQESIKIAGVPWTLINVFNMYDKLSEYERKDTIASLRENFAEKRSVNVLTTDEAKYSTSRTFLSVMKDLAGTNRLDYEVLPDHSIDSMVIWCLDLIKYGGSLCVNYDAAYEWCRDNSDKEEVLYFLAGIALSSRYPTVEVQYKVLLNVGYLLIYQYYTPIKFNKNYNPVPIRGMLSYVLRGMDYFGMEG